MNVLCGTTEPYRKCFVYLCEDNRCVQEFGNDFKKLKEIFPHRYNGDGSNCQW